MKILILLIVFLSTQIVFSYEKITFKYPNYEKYSLDNGKTWSKKYNRINFIYPDFEKYSLDNGLTWFYVTKKKQSYNLVVSESQLKYSKIGRIFNEHNEFLTYELFNKNFQTLISGNFNKDFKVDLYEEGIYYLILSDRNEKVLVKVLKM